MAVLRAFLVGSCAVLWLLSCPFLRGQTSEKSEDLEVLVIIERSGGFAGAHEEFTVYRNGKIVDSAGVVHIIPLARLDPIIHKMAELNIAKSHKHKTDMAEAYCSDCFHYRIKLRYPSGFRVISLSQMQMERDSSIASLARNIRDLVSGLK